MKISQGTRPVCRLCGVPLVALFAATVTLSAPSLAQDASPQPDQPPRVDVQTSDGSTIPWSRLIWHVPDPALDHDLLLERAKEVRAQGDDSEAEAITRMLEIASVISNREPRIELTLEEALHRALATNYEIEKERFNPAMATAGLVQAESEFDAAFFLTLTKNKIDRPSASALQATNVDLTNLSTGLSKRIATGGTVTASWELNRTRTTLQFQTINPEYTSGLVLDINQPLLRGFGIDYNQSLIRIARTDLRVSEEGFHNKVSEILTNTETAYWRLVEARRNVLISARLLAEFEQIMAYLVARRDFDVIPVQLAATEADLEAERTKFVELTTTLFDAEGALVAMMNSEDISLIEQSREIIPTDFPSLTALVFDPMAELQTALDRQPALRSQRLLLERDKLEIARAKNAELPQLDLRVQAKSSGLAVSPDRAFDQSTSYNYIEYLVGIQFGLPIGNRAARAATKAAELQYGKDAADLKRLYDALILDVNTKVRAIKKTFRQIASTYESAEASVREVDSIVARAERKDINTLNSELGARRQRAGARSAMLNAMLEYNIAIIQLEHAKGTLLDYDHVELPFDDD